MLGNTITKFMSCLVLNFQDYLNKSKFFYLEKPNILYIFRDSEHTNKKFRKKSFKNMFTFGFLLSFFFGSRIFKVNLKTKV